MVKNTFSSDACPCGSGTSYSRCCQPFHLGTPAPTAEALMRSRYAAYVYRLVDYLLATWHPDTRPEVLDLDEDPPTRWLGLEIKHTEQSGDTAVVEFVARFKVNGKAQRLHERSRFSRSDGRWLYVDGDLY